MDSSPIFTNERMATRALAAEIRHAPSGFERLLRSELGGESLGALRDVRCEDREHERLDIVLEFTRGDDVVFSIGIEAKFDHQLTREQLTREQETVDRLFILVPRRDSVPEWIRVEYPNIRVISWPEALDMFEGSRLSVADIESIKLSKLSVGDIYRSLDMGVRLPGWTSEVEDNDSGGPAIKITSPALPDGRFLLGQIQTVGRGLPDDLADVCFEAFFGVEVDLGRAHFYDPETNPRAPAWAESLRTLQREVLAENEARFKISTTSAKPPKSKHELAGYKQPLADAHLAPNKHLAKGYVDWALGPKTTSFGVDGLPELAQITAEVFLAWFQAESSRLNAPTLPATSL